MVAEDKGIQSPKKTSITVTVYVTRNPHPPRFDDPGYYYVVINETVPLGTSVVKVNAEDEDDVRYILHQCSSFIEFIMQVEEK